MGTVACFGFTDNEHIKALKRLRKLNEMNKHAENRKCFATKSRKQMPTNQKKECFSQTKFLNEWDQKMHEPNKQREPERERENKMEQKKNPSKLKSRQTLSKHETRRKKHWFPFPSM